MCLYTSDSAHARVCVCVCVCSHCSGGSFISRSTASERILFPGLIIGSVRRVHGQAACGAEPNHYSSLLTVSADGSMLSFCGLIILSLQITKQNHKNKSCLTRINEVLSTRRRAARGTRGWSGPSVAGITAVCSLSLLSRFLWQGPPVLRRPSSDTCPTTLPCWKEKASFWGDFTAHLHPSVVWFKNTLLLSWNDLLIFCLGRGWYDRKLTKLTNKTCNW